MNTAVVKTGLGRVFADVHPVKPVALLILLAAVSIPGGGEIARAALADAYYQVSVFVAATLFVILLCERASKRDLGDIFARHKKWQVPMAAGLGVLPGCGGAVVVTTQYIRGKMSFGGMVAVLTSTMGDAAFLLLAKAPGDALIVFAVSCVVGVTSGYVVDFLHGDGFLRPKTASCESFAVTENPILAPFYRVWFLLFLPGAVIGLAIAFQIAPADEWRIASIDWVTPLGFFSALLAAAMWLVNPLSDVRMYIDRSRPLSRRVADITNFVSFWVIVGYLGYEFLVAFAGFDLRTLFAEHPLAVVATAIVIGFIPGCGPQVVVTTMYLNGLIPFSAQLANAISNDGDALFPAIAVSPRAAVVATLYSAIPAAIVGFGWHFLFS